MSELSDADLLNTPVVAECGDHTCTAFIQELRTLEMTWASPPSRSVHLTRERANAAEPLRDVDSAARTSPESGTSVVDSEAPPFPLFEPVADSPVDALLHTVPFMDVQHVPGRVLDYVATTGEHVTVDVGDVRLGKGAVAVIYAGTLGVHRTTKSESTNSVEITVACRVQPLERWLVGRESVLWAHRRCRHPNVIGYLLTTVRHHGSWAQLHEQPEPSSASVVSVLEMASGGNLRDLIGTNGHIAVSDIHDVLHDIVSALKHVHEVLRLVHNDVKPGNILLCRRPRQGDGREGYRTVQYKLADFDCAQPLKTSTDMEDRLRAVDMTELPPCGQASGAGTTVYMAPEVSLGLCHFAPNDVWSVGVTAFHMVSGALPWRPLECQYPDLITSGYREKFARGGMLQRIRTQAATDTRSPRGFGPNLGLIMSDLDCPPLLRDFICQCLTEDPRERPTCRQLLEHPFLRDSWRPSCS